MVGLGLMISEDFSNPNYRSHDFWALLPVPGMCLRKEQRGTHSLLALHGGFANPPSPALLPSLETAGAPQGWFLQVTRNSRWAFRVG